MTKKLHARALSLLFASALAASAPFARSQGAPPQQQPAPSDQADEVVRISTELVQTDVMVFDRQGRFVEGLKPEQFELTVDGKPRPLSFFEAVKSGTFEEEAQLSAARGRPAASRPAAAAASRPLDRGRHFVLFVDDLHITPDALPRTREMLRRFVDEQMGQNDEAAVFTTTGQLGLLQQMTGEKEVLRLAATRLTSRYLDTREGAEQTPMTEAQAYAIERNERPVIDYFIAQLAKERRMVPPARNRGMAPNRTGGAVSSGMPNTEAQLETAVRMRARAIVQQAFLGARNTLTSLEKVVTAASALPGRKVLFFVSGGFMLDPQNNSAVEELRQVTAAAARSGTVIYTLDSRGLTTSPVTPDASTRAAYDPGMQLVAVNSTSLSATQEPLHALASFTGGRALLDTNDPQAGITQALNETSQYYILAWRPEADTGGGKFRTVAVRVKDRPDLVVRMRSGYADEAAKAEEAKAGRKKDKKSGADAELMAALRSLYPRRALPTAVSAGYMDASAGDPQLTVSVEVDAEALGLRPDGTGEPATLDLVGAVVNDKGEGVAEFQQSLTVAPMQTSRGRRRVLYNRQLQLKPGLYQVRVGSRDPRTGRTGSSSQWVEVPDVKKSGLALSSLFVGDAGDGSGQLAVCADRRFARDSRLGFFLYVYNASQASAPPDVALQVQIFRDDQPVVTRPIFKVETAGLADLARLPYGEDLSLSSLPAGRYVLQVTAIDRAAKSSASRRASFVIE